MMNSIKSHVVSHPIGISIILLQILAIVAIFLFAPLSPMATITITSKATAAESGVVPKFSAGDMVRTKVGGYVGQISLMAGTGGGVPNYDVRFTNPCGGGFLFDYVSMKEFEIEPIEMMEPNNGDSGTDP